MNANFFTRSSLAVAVALSVWSSTQVRSAEPAHGMMMMEGKMMERCQAMKEQKEKMMADMKMQDIELATEVAKMNSAPESRKVRLMAAVVTHMVEQQTALNTRKAKMEDAMMKHMMQHMQMGMESMAQCPMMKGMKDMDDKSEGDHKEHHAEPK